MTLYVARLLPEMVERAAWVHRVQVDRMALMAATQADATEEPVDAALGQVVAAMEDKAVAEVSFPEGMDRTVSPDQMEVVPEGSVEAVLQFVRMDL